MENQINNDLIIDYEMFKKIILNYLFKQLNDMRDDKDVQIS